jgi:hypothetical protein
MRSFFLSLLIPSVLVFVVGCGHETKSKTTETVSGPGGSTTVTKETTVEQTGKNPPSP